MSQELELHTKRLILREFKTSDKSALIKGINDFEIAKYLEKVPHPYTEADADWFFNHIKEKSQENPRQDYYLAITLAESQEFLGSIGIHHIDLDQKTASIGYWLSRQHHRNGYMFEAASEVIRFCFNDLDLRRLDIGAYSENQASNCLIQKLGFTYEGKKRQGSVSKASGQIYDVNTYALLKKDLNKT